MYFVNFLVQFTTGDMKRTIMLSIQRVLRLIALISCIFPIGAFFQSRPSLHKNTASIPSPSARQLALFPDPSDLSKEKAAQKAIDTVVSALRKDKSAQAELGNLLKVNNILGFGSPTPGKVAVRFNASFQRNGKGMSAIPMPFGLGQTNQSEGRGVMVGQVKASVDSVSGKVLECSVFRDLGYGRSFNLKLPQ